MGAEDLITEEDDDDDDEENDGNEMNDFEIFRNIFFFKMNKSMKIIFFEK